MEELTAPERAALHWVEQLAAVSRLNMKPESETASWRYSSVAELLLDQGRFFTPGLTLSPLGASGACYANASNHADIHDDEIYVEGLASPAAVGGIALEHAWCARNSIAVDPTWNGAAVYLGIPFTDDYRHRRLRQTQRWALLWSSDVLELLRDGIPTDARADIGLPIPSLSEAPAER